MNPESPSALDKRNTLSYLSMYQAIELQKPKFYQ